MARFDVNLVPRYNQDDLDAYGAPARAIGTAIGQYQQQQDASRQERNRIAQEGGVPTGPPPPTAMENIRSMGNTIKQGARRVFTPGAYQADQARDAMGTMNAQAGAYAGGTQPQIQEPPQMGAMTRTPNTPSAPPAPGTSTGISRIGGAGIMPGDLGRPSGEQGTMWDERIPTGGFGAQPGARSTPGAGRGGVGAGGAGGATGGAPRDIGSALGGYGGTYDYEDARGQHYSMTRQYPPQVLSEIIRAQTEAANNQNTRASAERVAGIGASARVTAAGISAAGRAAGGAGSEDLNAERRANTQRIGVETKKLSDEAATNEQARRNGVADRLEQSLQSQNPGRSVTPQIIVQYYGGLVRNGQVKDELSSEELYSALDRYHNPPNRAPTAMETLLQGAGIGAGARGGSAPGTGGAIGGGRGAGAGVAGAGAGRGAAPPAAQTGAPTGAGKPLAGAGRVDPYYRYNQLQSQGLDAAAIVRQMTQEGYPPPAKRP